MVLPQGISMMVAALAEHSGPVRLVTVVLGGNDVVRCLPPRGDAVTSATDAGVRDALARLTANL